MTAHAKFRAEILDLPDIFQSLQNKARSGTLKIQNAEGVWYLYFNTGSIEAVRTKRFITPLGKALLNRGAISEEQLNHALSLQKLKKHKLGKILVELGYTKPDLVNKAVHDQVTDEICELLTWTSAQVEFHKGDPPLDIFDPDHFVPGLRLSPTSMVMESARRQDEWRQIQKSIPSLEDIYAHNPESLFNFSNSSETQNEREVLASVDGRRNVHEIVEAVHLHRFDVLQHLVNFIKQADVYPLKPADLVGVAIECEREGKVGKALGLYLRAEELGVVQFDLPKRIAKAYELNGDQKRAVERYEGFAQLCEKEDFPEVAAGTYRKILEIQPLKFESRLRLIELLKEIDRHQQAIDHYHFLADYYRKNNLEDQLLDALTEIVSIDPSQEDAYRELAELHRARGDKVHAINYYEELAGYHLEQGQADRAVDCLRQALEVDSECIEARLQLATTLAKSGRTSDAVVEYNNLANSLSSSGVIRNQGNWHFLINIYKKIAELDQSNWRARQWLAHAYREKQQTDVALGYFKDLLRIFHSNHDDAQLVDVLQTLSELEPDQLQHLGDRADAHKRLQQPEAAAQALHKLAKRAVMLKKLDLAVGALDDILSSDPFDLGAHTHLAEIFRARNAQEVAYQKYLDVARMARIAHNWNQATDACRIALELNPEAAEIHIELARIYLDKGEHKLAVRELNLHAGISRKQDNIGLARASLKKILDLEPQNDDAAVALDALNRHPIRAEQKAVTKRLKPVIIGGGSNALPNLASGSVVGIAGKLKNFGGRARTTRLPSAASSLIGRDLDPGNKPQNLGKKLGGALSRLRAMKGGGDSREPTPTAQRALHSLEGVDLDPGSKPRNLGKKLGGALSRLKSLKSGEDTSEPQATESAALGGLVGRDLDPGSKPKNLGKKLGGALSRLKALKGGAEPAPPATTSQALGTLEGRDLDPGNKPKNLGKKLGGALSRLKALKAGTDPAPAKASIVAPSERPKKKKKKALGGALSRLKAMKGGSPPSAGPDALQALAGKDLDPGARGIVADEATSKRVSLASNRLKALKKDR